MIVQKAKVGARGVDSVAFSMSGTASQAKSLNDSGIDFFVGYLGMFNRDRLKMILDAGMAFMPVTVAGAYDGKAAAATCVALGLPKGCTVWLDLEGKKAFSTPPEELKTAINDWATAIIASGYEPGLYIGSPQPLTGDELYHLKVVRYWKAPSRVVDRNGKVWDGPSCGFCMYQLWPSVTWGTGVWTDVNFIQQDFRGRLPSWVKA